MSAEAAGDHDGSACNYGFLFNCFGTVRAVFRPMAVACAVFLLGRALVGSGSASDQLHRPELAISAVMFVQIWHRFLRAEAAADWSAGAHGERAPRS